MIAATTLTIVAGARTVEMVCGFIEIFIPMFWETRMPMFCDNTWFQKSVRSFLTTSCVTLMLSSAPLLHAQTVSRWIAVDGNWSEASNWDNGVPSGNVTAIIEGSAGVVQQDVPQLQIDRVRLEGSHVELILEQPLTVFQSLDWQQGLIGGKQAVTIQGDAQIANAVLETTLENLGCIEVFDEAGFPMINSFNGAVWNNRPGSQLLIRDGVQLGNFVSGSMGQLNIDSGATVIFEGVPSGTGWSICNQGKLEVKDTIVLFIGDYVQSETATLVLENGFADYFEITDFQGNVVGNGSLANLDGVGFSAAIQPGGNEIGTIEVAGSLPMTRQAITEIQIGPGLSSDRIDNIGGALVLDGVINIAAMPGASVGTYTLFTFNNPSGLSIDGVELGNVPAGFDGELELDLPNQTVNLVVNQLDPVVLFGDVNQDGQVDLLDVQPFVALLFDGGFQAEADINEDDVVNLLDVALFVALLQN